MPELEFPISPEDLRQQVEETSKRLLAQFPADEATGDAVALMREICEQGKPVVGQPPMAAQKLLRLTRRASTSFNELTKTIHSDPALTQGVLKLSNSAAYGAGRKISSVSMGVQLIGVKGVEIVVLGQIAKGLMCRPGGLYDQMVEDVWEHMIRVSSLARAFAPAFGVGREEAYTVGLLHDIGKLVLFDHMTTLRNRKRRTLEISDDFVQKALGSLHEGLGGLACMEWGLDQGIIEGIATHHRKGTRPGDAPMGQVTFLAERIDIAHERGEDVDLNELWGEGSLGGSLEKAQKVFADMTAEAPAEAVAAS